jgi:DNA-binding response OmpR family regulator
VDDYLVKPVALPELEIRLRSLVARLRRSIAPDHVLAVGDLSFNLRTLEVARGGRQVQLSRTSRHLLELLMRESPKVVARQRLEQVAWGEETPEIDLLRSHMYVLRRAIDQGSEPKLLHTISGVGYRLCELQ